MARRSLTGGAFRIAATAMLVGCSLAGCRRADEEQSASGAAPAPPRVEIVIGVDEALHGAAKRAMEILRVRHPRFTITARAGTSGELARLVRARAPIDLLLLSDPGRMAQLAAEGLVDPESIQLLAGDGLVLLAVPDSAIQPRRPQDLLEAFAEAEVPRLAMADPDDDRSSARVAEHLAEAGVWDALRDRIRFTADGSEAGALVATGEVDGALLRLTDALALVKDAEERMAPAPRIAMTFPLEPSLHEVAIVPQGPGAVRFPASTRVVYEFLAGDEFRSLLEELGFPMP